MVGGLLRKIAAITLFGALATKISFSVLKTTTPSYLGSETIYDYSSVLDNEFLLRKP